MSFDPRAAPVVKLSRGGRFTRATIEQTQAEAFMLLVNTFETATLSLLMNGATFPRADHSILLASETA